MKKATAKIISIVLVISVLFSLTVSAAAENTGENTGDVVLYSSDVKAGIVVEEDCTQTDYFAACVINDYIGRITGTKPGITKGDYDGTGNYIAIGSPAYTNLDTPEADGYIIRSDKNGVRISGAGKKGVSRAAYRFLEMYCDCHWYASDCVIVPEKSVITVPDNIDISYKPFFEFAECDTASSRVAEFNVANGGTGGAYCSIPEEMGGSVRYINGFAHTLTNIYCQPSKYFEEHPEYYALHNGERTPDQLCLTNPDVLEIVKNEVAQAIASSYNPDGGLQILSVTQNDNQNYCECKSCKALDEKNGSHAGTMVTFANAVAKSVEQYPNIAIDTFAYQYTRTVPTDVKPAGNVIIRLCSIECCFGHPLNDPNCKQNAPFMSDLSGWSKICSRVYIWDYVNNYRDTTSIFANFGVLQSNVQTFYENGAKGIYEEGNYYIANCDSEFGELKTYLLTRLFDNPYCDIEKETDGFLAAYYGTGWEYIKEFISVITDAAVTDKSHLGIYQHAYDSLPGLTKSDINKCNGLWEKAKQADATDFQRAKIQRSEISWRVWKSFNEKCEFSRMQFFFKWMKANDELYRDMKALGIVQLGEGDEQRFLSDIEILHYINTPARWAKENDGRAIVRLNGLAVRIFELLTNLEARFAKQ